MTDEEILAPGRLVFPNGYEIDVDSIWKGWVCYRVWPPGVEEQGMFDRAYRKPIATFVEQAREAGAARACNGALSKAADGRLLDGRTHEEFPA